MLPLVLLRRVGQYVNIKQPKEHVKLLSIYWDLPTECLLLNCRFTKAHFSSVHSASSGFCCHMFCNGNLRIVQREDSETKTISGFCTSSLSIWSFHHHPNSCDRFWIPCQWWGHIIFGLVVSGLCYTTKFLIADIWHLCEWMQFIQLEQSLVNLLIWDQLLGFLLWSASSFTFLSVSLATYCLAIR